MGLLLRDELDGTGDPEWLIAGVLPAGGVAMLYGQSGQGKSFWALDMAACITTGRNWNKLEVRQGDVVYVAGEGWRGISVRVQAWEGRHRIRAERFALYNQPVQLWRRDGGLTESAERLVAEINRLDLHPILLVFDTLGTCLGGADENDNGQMNQLCDAVEALVRPWNASALLVHHVGKHEGKTPRGAQALQDRMAMHAALIGDGQTYGLLTCKKQKDGEPFAPVRRVLHKVNLGKDRDSLAFADDFQTGPRETGRRRVGWTEVRQLLLESPIPMSPKLVATALNMSRKAAWRHLNVAESRKEVWQTQPGYYVLNPAFVPQPA